LLLLVEHVVHPKAKAWLVGREHRQEELGGKVVASIGSDGLEGGAESLTVGLIVRRDQRWDGELGAFPGSVQERLPVGFKFMVTCFSRTFGVTLFGHLLPPAIVVIWEWTDLHYLRPG
jgi:hypothetical protein